jgi:hypothetical protein
MSVKVKQPAAHVALRNVGTAPVVYFDNVPTFGSYVGIIELQLSTRVLLPKPDGGVIVENMSTAHLRCPPASAQALIEALQRGLKMYEQQLAEAQKAAAESPKLNS